MPTVLTLFKDVLRRLDPAEADANFVNLRATADALAAALGGFTASQTPGANQIPVTDVTGGAVLNGAANQHLMLKLNAAVDKYSQVGFYENAQLKWAVYNDFNTDAFSFGTSTGVKAIVTTAGTINTFCANAAAYNLFRGSSGDWVFGQVSSGLCSLGGLYGVHNGLLVDSAGTLFAGGGLSSGTCHVISKAVGADAGEGIIDFTRAQTGISSLRVFACSQNIANAANAAIKTGRDGITLRAINASGTINASGADYAEYEKKAVACGAVLKGQIIGFNAEGEVVDLWADAVSFGVKSTNPNLVGGDTWGGVGLVGERPVEPMYQRPEYVGVPDPGHAPEAPMLEMPGRPVQQEGEDEFVFSVRVAAWGQVCGEVSTAHTILYRQYQEDLLAWQITADQFAIDLVDYQIALDKAAAAHEAVWKQWLLDVAEFEARLEVERQKVDRIAYSGKVPCNVIGAKPGDYIIAAQEGEGIKGEIVTSPTFEQYRRAVGRVRRILADGRAEIAVIVH